MVSHEGDQIRSDQIRSGGRRGERKAKGSEAKKRRSRPAKRKKNGWMDGWIDIGDRAGYLSVSISVSVSCMYLI